MMMEMKIKEPAEFQHNHLTIDALFSVLETDFYGRFRYE
jgi:hypothetical protein